MNALDWIVDWFESKSKVSREELISGKNKNYLETGWIDSFTFIELVTEVESHYGKQFSDKDFEDVTFFTIDGLAKKVEL